jgi:hypothetical protein
MHSFNSQLNPATTEIKLDGKSHHGTSNKPLINKTAQNPVNTVFTATIANTTTNDVHPLYAG